MVISNNDPLQWKDSIGRNFYAMLAFPEKAAKYYFPITRCHALVGDHLHVFRHPAHPDNDDMSRDHWFYTLLAAHEMGDRDLLELYNKYMKFRISDKFRHTLGSYCWSKAITGSKAYWVPWYITNLIEAPLYLVLNKLLYLVAPFQKELPILKYIQLHPMPRTKRQLWARKLLYPAYSQQIHGYCIRAAPFKPLNWLLRKLSLPIVGRYNIAQRLLFKSEVHPAIIRGHYPTTGWRSGVYLNETCDRHIRYFTDEEREGLGDMESKLIIRLLQEL